MRKRKMSMSFFAICFLSAFALAVAQRSSPAVSDIQVQQSAQDNKYLKETPLQDIIFGTDASGILQHNSKCPLQVDLEWGTESGASVFATPVIDHFLPTGHKQLVIPTFLKEIELLNGEGHREPGWPFVMEDATFHASPLLYDVNQDGSPEVLAFTSDARVVVIGQHGNLQGHLNIKVAPLTVSRTWYSGLQNQDGMFENQYTKPGELAHPSALPAATKRAGARHLLQVQTETETEAKATDRTTTTDTTTDTDTSKDPVVDKFQGVHGALDKEAEDSMDLFTDDLGDDYMYDDYDYDSHDEEDEDKSDPNSRTTVAVDAHLFTNPVIGDMEGDGLDELVLPVTYMFDPEEFDRNPSKFRRLPTDIDISKYVGGGIAVYQLSHKSDQPFEKKGSTAKWGSLKWKVHLDLSTNDMKFRAYIFSPPTIVDLDRDGVLEVVVGTSMGFIYVLNGVNGDAKPGWPFQIADIHGQVIAADVYPDPEGRLEIIASDRNGNVVCLSSDAKVLWERRISGYTQSGLTVGDVNGDGVKDVVLGTSTGLLWVLRGDNGQDVSGFPLKAENKIVTTVTLVDLTPDAPSKGLHLIFPAFDGHIYIVDGRNGCTNKLDVGEHIYSQVLVDDVRNRGTLDLLVTTMNGNVYCFGTDVPAHPLKTWTSPNQGRNGFVAREHQGIFVTESSRLNNQVWGTEMSVAFEIVDDRNLGPIFRDDIFYTVSISFYGGGPLFKGNYTRPARYSQTVSTPPKPVTAVVHVQMKNEFSQYFYDSYPVSFNIGFHRLLKWILIVPFTLMSVTLLFVKDLRAPLPV